MPWSRWPMPCGGRGPVTLRVTTEQLGKRSERSTVLTPPERDDPRWPEVVMDLPLQGGAHGVGMRVPAPCRALDVGEEEGDGAGGELAHGSDDAARKVR